jgi:hypothetical protein
MDHWGNGPRRRGQVLTVSRGLGVNQAEWLAASGAT